MDLSIDLPDDCFCNILKYLSIDERINARPLFPKFDLCFSSMNEATKKCTAFGIDLLKVANIPDKRTDKLCSLFHLYEPWICAAGPIHIPGDGFSTNNSIMEPVCF